MIDLMTLAARIEILENVASKHCDQFLTVKFQRLTFAFADLKLLIPDLFAIAVGIRRFY